MSLQLNLSSNELIVAVDNLNNVLQLQNATSDTQQRALLAALPTRIQDQIFFNVWDQANRPPEANYGQNHAFDSLIKLKLATQSVVAECIKTTASCLQSLPQPQLDQIYYKIWHQAGEPPVADYGVQHAFDDPAKLHQIVHDVLQSQQTPSSPHSSCAALPQAPTPAATTTPVHQSTPSEQIAARAQAYGAIIFYDQNADPLTCVFGNFHPCLFQSVFQDQWKLFGNAEAAFQCQKYTDQPQIAALFTVHTTGDQAVALSRQYPMTPQRLSQWDSPAPGNKIDAMMNVLRCKFGGNPDLKTMLMATGSAYLCEHLPDAHRRDNFWSDGFDGSAPNELGKALMRLRGEYGGTGEVQSPWGTLNGPAHLTYPSALPAQTPQPLNAAREVCILPSCTRPRYEGHQFCSLTHAQLYNSNCDNCHDRPKFVETSGRVHNYCGRSCAQIAQLKK